MQHKCPVPSRILRNAVDLRVSGFSDIFSGVRKMLFRRRKNIIFALRIRSELPMSTALQVLRGRHIRRDTNCKYAVLTGLGNTGHARLLQIYRVLGTFQTRTKLSVLSFKGFPQK
ncbi:Uncharacterized protein dnm_038240 [Desulfonema magnum]|uniref:Uncharacterized protein n=1 Tax=Desulfonema magnum TaxID=45655 RepID=A0A975BLI0_9BACT|nr:Uncharacterized protein dnm_038240 [Desulfonema magnum]